MLGGQFTLRPKPILFLVAEAASGRLHAQGTESDGELGKRGRTRTIRNQKLPECLRGLPRAFTPVLPPDFELCRRDGARTISTEHGA